jgi:uncharacterized membrane protein
MNVDAIRQELRNGQSPSLQRRRKVALLSAVGLVDFALISLYQMGVIRHLPDPPGRLFDSDKVNASHKAYMMGLPDGTTGAALYALNLMLASAGGSRKASRHPVFDVLLAGAVAASAVGALHYLYDMVTKQQRACPYCLVGAALNFSMVPLVARDAWGGAVSLMAGPGGRRASLEA